MFSVYAVDMLFKIVYETVGLRMHLLLLFCFVGGNCDLIQTIAMFDPRHEHRLPKCLHVWGNKIGGQTSNTAQISCQTKS